MKLEMINKVYLLLVPAGEAVAVGLPNKLGLTFVVSLVEVSFFEDLSKCK